MVAECLLLPGYVCTLSSPRGSPLSLLTGGVYFTWMQFPQARKGKQHLHAKRLCQPTITHDAKKTKVCRLNDADHKGLKICIKILPNVTPGNTSQIAGIPLTKVSEPLSHRKNFASITKIKLWIRKRLKKCEQKLDYRNVTDDNISIYNLT